MTELGTDIGAGAGAPTPARKRSERAVLLLGHGSKAAEANETLRRVARTVKERGGYGAVVPGFLQIEKPDFQEAVDSMVADGYRDITVMPYFLYMGLHVTKDLPEEMEKACERHEGLKLKLTGNLGYHSNLIDVTIERIEEHSADGAPAAASTSSAAEQHPIEAESFRIITEELGETGLAHAELSILKRVIHTTADFEFRDLLAISPGAIAAGVAAIAGGAPVITDVNMVASGITPARLARFGVRTTCATASAEAARLAEKEGITRTAAAMRLSADALDGAVVAIGNAPTALRELLRLVGETGVRPALVVGVPVGFVGAAESKDELMASGIEFIATRGRKGGSTVAAAIVNALAILAHERAGAA